MSFRDLLPWNWNWRGLLPGRHGKGGWLARWTGGEPPGEVLLEADLPGVVPEDLRVEVRGDRLVVSACRRREERRSDSGYSLLRRSWAGTHRVVGLPPGVDPESLEARLENGVLRVFGRVEQETTCPARIPVRAA